MPVRPQPPSSNPYRWAALAVIVMPCIIAIMALWPKPDHLDLKTGALLPMPKTLIQFDLQNADGKPFTNADLNGRWTLIYTGYTHCPDVCPTTLAALAQVVGKLGSDTDRLRVLFLSVDPKRDKPPLLLKYAHAFNPAFIAATGSQTQLKALGHNLGFTYSYEPPTKGDPDDYVVNHSSGMMLVNPDGQLYGYFSLPIQVSAMAADLRHVIDNAGT